MQDFQISTLPVSAINQADTGFKITGVDEDVSALADSMAATGLCVPPLVCANETGYTMVSGFKRLAAAVSLKWKTIPCRVAKADSKKKLAIQAVAENAFQQELTPGEMLRAIALLNQHMDAKEMAQTSPAIFNTTLNAGYIKNLTRIHNLPDPAMALLDTGHLSVKAAKALADLKPGAATAFLTLFAGVRASSSKQMEIMTWTKEICARENLSVSELFRQKEFTDILKPENPSAVPVAVQSEDRQAHKDKAAAGNLLRGMLFQKRFPSLDKAKKTSVKNLQALKLPRGVRMVLPENFESMEYSLSLNFKSSNELRNQLTCLDTLADHVDFKELLKR